MTPPRRISADASARLRNRAIVKRNAKKAAANPLFEAAGILDQVVPLEAPNWDRLRVIYFDLARDIASYEWWLERERRHRRQWAVYVQMLDEAIGAENREEVLADYDQRYPKGHSMQQWEYRLSYLNTYLARYLKRTPLEVFHEAQARMEA